MRVQSKIVCLVGPSGIGKTFFANRLVEKHNFALPVVATTRTRRPDDDEHYYYVSKADFMKMANSSCFLEWDYYSNYYYGTLARSVEELANNEKHPGVVLDLTPTGCIKVKEVISTAFVIALLPDDPTWLTQRLLDRNSQPTREIQARMDMLRGYLDQIDQLACQKVYVSFSPDTWESSFEMVEAIVFRQTATHG